MKTRIVYYFVGVIISLLALASVARLSAYAHNSNNDLLATREQLNGLQGSYTQLKAEQADLNKEKDQVTADLKTAHGQIASLEEELKMAKEQNQKLEQTIKMTRLNMNVLDGLFDDSVTLEDMQARITATGNAELNEKWNVITNQDELGGFIIYLVHSVWTSLN